MVTIQKTGEGYYLATIPGKREILNRSECHFIRKDMVSMLAPHRQISLNMQGVKYIDTGGWKIFKDLIDHANNKKCIIRFINPEKGLNQKINELNNRKNLRTESIEIE